MKYKQLVWALVAVLVLLMAINKLYYTLHPNQLSIQPMQLSLLNVTTHDVRFLDRKTDFGKSVLKRMYGLYDKLILDREDLPISTASSAEFTLPQLARNNEVFVLREHPNLRYELWKSAAPDLILLGSSMFFCDFDRESFFSKHPGTRLLDCTTGNNTPFIANYFIRHADSLNLLFKPGTIVLYGMNRVEMLAGYKDRNSHDFVKNAISGKAEKELPDRHIAEFLKIPELRHDALSYLKNTYDDWFRGTNKYRKEIDAKYRADEAAFINYQQTIAVAGKTVQKFDRERIDEIKDIAALLKKYDCKLVVLKLPQSLYNDISLNTPGHSYFDDEMGKIQDSSLAYIDVSDFRKFNITQLDYIWPGNVFDPEHLNVHGAKRFTQALMQNVLDTMLTQQNLEN